MLYKQTYDDIDYVKWYRRTQGQDPKPIGYTINRYTYYPIGLWEIAARKGHADAQYCLGFCYAYGRSGVDKDYGKAKTWLRMSARQGCQEAKKLLRKIQNKY